MADKYFECVIVQNKCQEHKFVVVLQVLNEVDPHPPDGVFRVPLFLSDCRDFQEPCPVCAQEFPYTREDIHVMQLANQTLGLVSARFAEAMAPVPAENEAQE